MKNEQTRPDLSIRYDEVRQLRAQADDLEAKLVREALRASDGLVKRAARMLGMEHRALDQLLRRGRLKHLDGEVAHVIGRPPTQKGS
jgi:transcriptional regulator with GAF, ATPase, and Fis domain